MNGQECSGLAVLLWLGGRRHVMAICMEPVFAVANLLSGVWLWERWDEGERVAKIGGDGIHVGTGAGKEQQEGGRAR
jgi:hypothetical protein